MNFFFFFFAVLHLSILFIFESIDLPFVSLLSPNHQHFGFYQEPSKLAVIYVFSPSLEFCE